MPLGTSIPAVTRPSARPRRSDNFRGQRRQSHRVPCRVSLQDSGGGHVSVLGETINVSDDGMAVQIGVEPAIGTFAEVLIPHLEGEPACLSGLVVHCRRVTTGTVEVGISLGRSVSPSDA